MKAQLLAKLIRCSQSLTNWFEGLAKKNIANIQAQTTVITDQLEALEIPPPARRSYCHFCPAMLNHAKEMRSMLPGYCKRESLIEETAFSLLGLHYCVLLLKHKGKIKVEINVSQEDKLLTAYQAVFENGRPVSIVALSDLKILNNGSHFFSSNMRNIEFNGHGKYKDAVPSDLSQIIRDSGFWSQLPQNTKTALSPLHN